jgi:aspartate racemase
MTSPSPSGEITQVSTPGFVGMGLYTDLTYLRAFQTEGNTVLSSQLSSVQSVLFTTNFHQLAGYAKSGNWNKVGSLTEQALTRLKGAGADFAVVTSNTCESLVKEASEQIGIRLLPIADVTVQAIKLSGEKKLGLLSTSQTNLSRFYQRPAKASGVAIIEPDGAMANAIDGVIFNELIFGHISPEGVDTLMQAIEYFASAGADGVILGCTDLTLATTQLADATHLPLFDSTLLHAKTAARIALGVAPWPLEAD